MHGPRNGRPMTLTSKGGELKCVTTTKLDGKEKKKKSKSTTVKFPQHKYFENLKEWLLQENMHNMYAFQCTLKTILCAP